MRASGIVNNCLTLSWDEAVDNVGVTAYRVYKGETLLGEVNYTVCKVSGLVPNTTYTFKVEAVDAAGNRSSDVLVTTATTKEGLTTRKVVQLYSGFTYVDADENQNVGTVKVENDLLNLFEAEGGTVKLSLKLPEGTTWHGELTEEDFIAGVSVTPIDEDFQVSVTDITESSVAITVYADSGEISCIRFDLPNLDIPPGTQGYVMVWVEVLANDREGLVRFYDAVSLGVAKVQEKKGVSITTEASHPLEAGNAREASYIIIEEYSAGFLDPEKNHKIILTAETEGVTFADVDYYVSGFDVDGATFEDEKTVSFKVTEKSQAKGKLIITPYLNIASHVNGDIKIGVQAGDVQKVLVPVGQVDS